MYMGTDKPLTNRKRQAIQTKQRIFDTAKELFSKNSFETVTVDQIIEACGIAKGTFYYYYRSKDELLDSIERVPYADINQKIRELAGQPAAVRLRRYILLWFLQMEQDDVGFTGHWLKHAVDPDRKASGLRDDTKMDFDMEMIRQIYTDGIASGELSPDTPVDTLVAEIHFSMVGSAVYRCERKGDFAVMEWAERFADLCVDKFLVPYRGGPR